MTKKAKKSSSSSDSSEDSSEEEEVKVAPAKKSGKASGLGSVASGREFAGCLDDGLIFFWACFFYSAVPVPAKKAIPSQRPGKTVAKASESSSSEESSDDDEEEDRKVNTVQVCLFGKKEDWLRV